MHNYRLETVLIVISLGALLFLMGSTVLAIAQPGGADPAHPAAQALSVPVSTKVPDALAQARPKATLSTSAPAARSATCVPVPAASTLAPGPDALVQVTPPPIAHRYDLAPNISQDLRSSVLVFRCDGTWDQYWLGPAQVLDPQKDLKTGDVIFSVSPPASNSATKPPESTGPTAPGSTVTVQPTLPALTPTTASRSATPSGYPNP
jgi:hypothetical protein